MQTFMLSRIAAQSFFTVGDSIFSAMPIPLSKSTDICSFKFSIITV